MTQKLLSTTAFRLSLIYALLFSLIATGALGLAYLLAAQQIRQQTDDRLQLETNVMLSRYYSGSFSDLLHIIEHRTHKDSSRFFVYSLTQASPESASLDGDKPKDKDFGNRSEKHEQTFAKPVFTTLPLNEITPLETNKNLETRVLITPLPNHSQLLVGSDLSEQKQLLNHIARIMLLAVLVTLVAALTGGALLGYGSLRRIEKIRQKTEAIIEGDLSLRMPIHQRLLGHKQEDEYDKLSHVINHMLDRLEILVHSTQNTTNNLAHDLRNPLNRLRHRLESVRSETSDPEQNSELGYAVEEIDQLVATFNAILNIAQIKASVQRDHWENIDVSAMIEDLGDMYSVVAEEKGIRLQVQTEPDLQLNADRQLLAQAITNLLDNAIKYTPNAGLITFKAYKTKDHLIIHVSDNGPGVPEKDRAQIFQHLTRLDNARSQPGNGLGLSLVKAIMDLHPGSHINVQDNKPGLMIELVFPNTHTS